MLKRTLALAGLVVATTCATASAAIWTLEADMTGAQEVPANISTATGYLQITLDDSTGSVNVVTGSYAGLTANASAAHIHGLSLPGFNSPPIITLTHTGGLTGTLSGSGTLTAPQITGMLNGQTYVNVHNATYPGGEVRGQLAVVPEPATLGLLATAGMLLLRRKPAAE